MKLLSLPVVLGMFLCTGCQQPQENLESTPVVEPKTYFEGRIEGFNIRLHDVQNRCTLTYAPVGSSADVADLDIGMDAPCDFIRASWKEFKPLIYTYGKDAKRVTVLLITGGPPADPTIKDEFQPDGCGTWMAKVLVFSNRIELEKSGWNGPPWCPSSGADEVMFAA